MSDLLVFVIISGAAHYLGEYPQQALISDILRQARYKNLDVGETHFNVVSIGFIENTKTETTIAMTRNTDTYHINMVSPQNAERVIQLSDLNVTTHLSAVVVIGDKNDPSSFRGEIWE